MTDNEHEKQRPQNPLSSFYSKDGELDGMSLTWIYDQRSAQDILSEWINHSQNNGIDNNNFIEKCLDLQDHLSRDDISHIIANEHAIGENLAIHMSAHLPPEVGTQRVFLDRCKKTRQDNSVMCELNDDVLNEKRNTKIDNILLKMKRKTNEHSSLTTDSEQLDLNTSPLFYCVLENVMKLLHKQDIDTMSIEVDNIIENIASKTGLTLEAIKYAAPITNNADLEQCCLKLAELVSIGDTSVFDEVYNLSKQNLSVMEHTSDDATLGDVIRTARQYNGDTISDVSKALGCAISTSYFWENNSFSPSAKYVKPLIEYLKLTPAQTSQFLDILVAPYCAEGSLGHFIRKQRLNNGFTLSELSQEIGCNLESIQNWENNDNVPSNTHIKSIIETFHLDAEETDTLIGLTISKEIERDSLGFFIQKHRLIAGLTTNMLADKLSCSQNTVQKWESNDYSLSDKLIKPLIDALNLDEEQKGTFLKLLKTKRNPSHDDNKNTLGTFLYDARLKKGITLQTLAKDIACSDKAISQWENDEAIPYDKYLPLLQKVLELNSDETNTLHEFILSSHPAPDSTGYYIKKCRLRENLTAEELAEKIGSSPAVVNKWERNASSPPPKFIPMLFDILTIHDDEMANLISTESPIDTLGGFVEFHRKKAGFTPLELSEHLDKSRQWVRKVEKNQSTMDKESAKSIRTALQLNNIDTETLNNMINAHTNGHPPTTIISPEDRVNSVSNTDKSRGL